ncbi:MAG: DUF1838 domain-containing protein [Gammaproteobacteria bacterium]|nr:DUF1838 domain-containing protein [Gammaproteobacteria bacterium]
MKLLRREFLMGLGLATVLASDKTESMVSGTVPSSAPDLTLPVNNLLNLMRMQSTLGNEDQVPWHYNGTLYFKKGSEQPIPMVKIEGMESYKVIPQDDGSYEILGNMLTFFRDVDSGEMIRDYRNPYTGKVNKVSPNIRRASLGRGLNISTMGSRPTSFIDQMPDKPLILDWTFGPKTVWLHNQTSYPPGLSPPRVQRMTMFAPLDEFLDPNNLSLSTMFTATVLMPWLPWMDMDDVEGHTLWHASGVKLDSIDQLPEEYSKRMMAEHPELSGFNLEEDTGPVIYE